MRLLTITFLVLAATILLPAEEVSMEVHQAELAIPFAAEDGYLITAGDQLLFINSERTDESFALKRESIREFHTDNGVVGVVVDQPLRNQKRFNFRLTDPAAVETLASWKQESEAVVGPPARLTEAATAGSYRAQHNHFVTGSCEGHLIITDELVSYESLSRAEHSRQWKLGEIQEISRKNPYRVSINPFSGSEYDFRLLQDRMPNDQYKQLSASIAEARASQ